jgi:hypothetical protein
MASGVIAVGVGQQTTAAGAERLAGRLFEAGLATTVLAVPIAQLPGFRLFAGAADRGVCHLDTVCTVVSDNAVLMHPAAAYTLTAHTITQQPEGMRVSRAQPFLEAAAQAMSIDRLHVIDSGTEPAWGRPGRWDDGSNVLAVAPGLVVSHERNSETNARLEAAGIEVLRVPSSELGSVRGGPRCMTCAIGRDAAAMAGRPQAPHGDGAIRDRGAADLGIAVPSSREATYSGGVLSVGAVAASGPATQPVSYARSAQPAPPERRPDLRPNRTAPKATPAATAISTISASQNSVLVTDAATKMMKIAATITSSIRSMTPSYALAGGTGDEPPPCLAQGRVSG